ncbi:restriction endonuclease [Salmonella enterica subsp. enterica serovar Cerro]|uniref:restriction endonuclease n=1 Tax=Escherichia coli TaxID=562 RepID=UPI001105D184|nr:restriction endonuclease [Escherichia coli]EEA6875229.1 restriction endonuclease [Salmonella enterica subsp. enterica serovar Cerro]EGK3295997.1 restriction endonuclease [Salmonella enterica subsp. enterica serovar Cerro]HEA7106424.1 hypothetical protein [Escherichia coli]HEA7946229.1 hypothetical protein [Escherichia coli]HEI2521362.1 hypothetical protein [Escherichia coli]
MREPSILERWEISEEKLTDLVDKNPSLRGMILGYVAEDKFHELFLEDERVKEVSKDDDHDRKKKGDRTFIYKGKKFTVEVKSLQTAMCKKNEDGTYSGKAQVDGSDRRIVKFPDNSELNTTLLLKGEFDLLAVNCFAFGEGWKFAFAKNSDLPTSTFKKYTEEQRKQLIASLIPVTWPPKPPFSDDPFHLLDEMIAAPEEEPVIEESSELKEVKEDIDVVRVKS